MSSSINVYVGPYIKINKTPTSFELVYACCTNAACESFQKFSEENFCPRCGNRILMGTVQKTGSLGWKDFDESTDYVYEMDFCSPEFLGADDEDIVICDDDGKYLDSGGETLPLSAGDVDIHKLQVFEAKHKIMLDKAKAFFPDFHLTLEIGVCSYWS